MHLNAKTDDLHAENFSDDSEKSEQGRMEIKSKCVADATVTGAMDAVEAVPMVVSIVSHGHGATVLSLLMQLAQQCATSITRVVVTFNIPEPALIPPLSGWPFRLDVVSNAVPRGFGENHNRALAGATEPLLCVLNPDVVLLPAINPFAELAEAALANGVGCSYPVQLDKNGVVQDSEREIPTPLSLWRRRVRGRRETRVDWVNAACLVLSRQVWSALGGFDTAYFMYCEDVDLCLRVRLQGRTLQRVNVHIEHSGQRASRRERLHLTWHIKSLLRLWCSPVFWRALFLLDQRAR